MSASRPASVLSKTRSGGEGIRQQQHNDTSADNAQGDHWKRLADRQPQNRGDKGTRPGPGRRQRNRNKQKQPKAYAPGIFLHEFMGFAQGFVFKKAGNAFKAFGCPHKVKHAAHKQQYDRNRQDVADNCKNNSLFPGDVQKGGREESPVQPHQRKHRNGQHRKPGRDMLRKNIDKCFYQSENILILLYFRTVKEYVFPRNRQADSIAYLYIIRKQLQL